MPPAQSPPDGPFRQAARQVGLPVAAMRTDAAFAVDYIEIICDRALELGGQTIPATPEHLHYTVREPFAVQARIVPYNHPLFFSASKLARLSPGTR